MPSMATEPLERGRYFSISDERKIAITGISRHQATCIGPVSEDTNAEYLAKVDLSREIGIKGRFKIRDVWRQKDVGLFENFYETEVPYHGVVLVKISGESD